MNLPFFLQITTDTVKTAISFNLHLVILALIILLTGLLGGYAGYLIEKNRILNSDLPSADLIVKRIGREKRYFLITGICASLLIPLFLSTISSQLMSNSQKEPLQYFVFGGFCLLVAIFSKQFITSLSEKILKEAIEKAQQQATETAKKLVDENKENMTDEVKKQVKEQTSSLESRISVWDDFIKLESQIKHPVNPKQLELADLTELLDKALQSEDTDLATQVYDRASIMCFDYKRNDLMEKLSELYSDKINLTKYAWADLAISKMNEYHSRVDPEVRKKAEGYIQKTLELYPDYGTPYSLQVYLDLIEYSQTDKTSAKAKDLVNAVEQKFNDLISSSSIDKTDAYNYIKKAEGTSFIKYNNLMKELFPEKWKEFEKAAGGG